VWSVLKLQRYLDGVPFTEVTDHQPILQVVSSTSKTLHITTGGALEDVAAALYGADGVCS
jgi:shikimate kinase